MIERQSLLLTTQIILAKFNFGNLIYIFFVCVSDGPVFRTRPKSVEADNGGSTTLTCDVVGNPSPDILWIHEPNDKVS